MSCELLWLHVNDTKTAQHHAVAGNQREAGIKTDARLTLNKWIIDKAIIFKGIVYN